MNQLHRRSQELAAAIFCGFNLFVRFSLRRRITKIDVSIKDRGVRSRRRAEYRAFSPDFFAV